jgi:hypothetical protein
MNLPAWWLRDQAVQASRAFNNHVRDCPYCDPLSNELCWLGDDLNDEASAAAALALIAETNES